MARLPHPDQPPPRPTAHEREIHAIRAEGHRRRALRGMAHALRRRHVLPPPAPGEDDAQYLERSFRYIAAQHQSKGMGR